MSQGMEKKQFKERSQQDVHDEVGLLGFKRALHPAGVRCYWLEMAKAIEVYMKCKRSFRWKAGPQKAAPLESISATHLLKLVCVESIPRGRQSRHQKHSSHH